MSQNLCKLKNGIKQGKIIYEAEVWKTGFRLDRILTKNGQGVKGSGQNCPSPLLSDRSARQPVRKENLQLRVDNPPVPAAASPLLGDIDHRQIQHFQQAVIGRKDRLGFGHFSQLSVEIFDGIGGVNQGSYFLWVLDMGRERCPVCPPGECDFRVFATPFLIEAVQFDTALSAHRRQHRPFSDQPSAP